MKITIAATYSATTTVTLNLPEGKVWSDVTNWYVKWGTLHAAFNDGEYQEIGSLGEVTLDGIDLKWPDRSTVYATLDDGTADYDRLLDEQIDIKIK